jgi:YfiH family protein
VRSSSEPADLVRPKQVHGCIVASVRDGASRPVEADAIVACEPVHAVGVVTADCVPILVMADGGKFAAAIHAGWRGLAAGVVEAGIDALRASDARSLRAAIGPHIGPCCYEVDDAVLDPLSERLGEGLEGAVTPVRAGHAMLDLAAAVRAALCAAGLAREDIGAAVAACTHCDPVRFHSFRRDGPRAGRLVHWVRSGLDTSEAPA